MKNLPIQLSRYLSGDCKPIPDPDPSDLTDFPQAVSRVIFQMKEWLSSGESILSVTTEEMKVLAATIYPPPFMARVYENGPMNRWPVISWRGVQLEVVEPIDLKEVSFLLVERGDFSNPHSRSHFVKMTAKNVRVKDDLRDLARKRKDGNPTGRRYPLRVTFQPDKVLPACPLQAARHGELINSRSGSPVTVWGDFMSSEPDLEVVSEAKSPDLTLRDLRVIEELTMWIEPAHFCAMWRQSTGELPRWMMSNASVVTTPPRSTGTPFWSRK